MSEETFCTSAKCICQSRNITLCSLACKNVVNLVLLFYIVYNSMQCACPSGLKWNLAISEIMHRRWKVTMDHCKEVMLARSEYVITNRMERPLADKSQWRHIRRALKPRYLGKHASHIKTYYGTLSGIHGRSFRIHHKNRLKRPWRRIDDDVMSGWQ